MRLLQNPTSDRVPDPGAGVPASSLPTTEAGPVAQAVATARAAMAAARTHDLKDQPVDDLAGLVQALSALEAEASALMGDVLGEAERRQVAADEAATGTDAWAAALTGQSREVLAGVAVRTPMEESRWLSELVGGEVRLKAENLQRTGSFKARGAYVRISRLSEEERARGVVAASAGNHAQGVALAAQLLGISATVFMPEGAPIPKERATRGYGAEVVFTGQYLEDALVAAHEFAERTGAVLIHPFDHPDVVAGQGTVGLEIIEQLPEVATVVVPTGGGGLLAGVALAVKALRPDVRVVGVQAKDAAAYPGSLEAGRPTPLAVMPQAAARWSSGSRTLCSAARCSIRRCRRTDPSPHCNTSLARACSCRGGTSRPCRRRAGHT